MRRGAELEARRIDVTLLSDFDTAALAHPEARGLFAMWTELRAGRPAPFRAELDASRIGARAPFLAILEYVGPSNFRVRIAGDRLNRWFGLELRGMSALSLVEAEARNHFQSVLNRLTAEPAVAVVKGQARGARGAVGVFEMALLPMRSDFGRIDRVLAGLWIDRAAGGPLGPVRLDAVEFVVAPIVEESVAEAEDAPASPPPAAAPAPGAGGVRQVRRGHLRLVKG